MAKNIINNKNKIPLKKFWNKFIYANLFFSFGIIALILSIVFKTKVDSSGTYGTTFIGNLVMSILFIVLSEAFSLFFIINMFKKGKNSFLPQMQLAASITTLIVPIAGAIVSYVWKKKETKAINQFNEKIDASYTKPKSFVASSFTIIFFIILVVILITWIVIIINGPIKNTEGETYKIPGVFDLFLAPVQGFIDAADLVVFLLVMGGFLAVVNQSKALEAGIGRLVQKMKGKEFILIALLILLFSLGGTSFGMCEETLPFYFIVTPLLLASGFDIFTVILIITMGAGLGVAGSIINPFLINSAVAAANSGSTTGTIATISDGIIWRSVGYCLLVITGISFTCWYANKVKKNPQKSIVYDQRNIANETFKFDVKTQIPFTTKRKISLTIFALSFVLMIVSVIDWQTLTGFTGFNDANVWLINHFPYLWSSQDGLGAWYLTEMTFIFFLSAIIIAALNWTNEENFFKTFFDGFKDFLSVALIIALARGLSIVLSDSGMNSLIINGLSSAIQTMGSQATIIVLFIVFTILSFLIPSTSGFASAVFPSIGPALYASGMTVSSGIMTFSFASGLVNVISPTAGPFIGALSITKTPLVSYYKGIWKFLLIILILMLTILLVGTVLPNQIF